MRDEYLAELYIRGTAVKELSLMAGRSEQHIYVMLRKAGIPMRPRGRTMGTVMPARRVKTFEARMDELRGRLQKEIAAEQGVAPSSVSQMLRRIYGVNRDKGGKRVFLTDLQLEVVRELLTACIEECRNSKTTPPLVVLSEMNKLLKRLTEAKETCAPTNADNLKPANSAA